ncbi:MAG: hypothetical protein JWR55_637 [Aeromicrobium sp.]|jgi:hypothetical protein|nr:hypothetical protein [Aeromicrobium sp.]
MSSPRSSRGNPAIGDIVRSMVVITAIILALYVFGKLFTSTPETTVKPIDYATVVAQARPAATFPLAAPADLPDGWRATSARFQPNGWHLGVLTDDDEYVGLEQLTVSVDRAVDRFAEDSKDGGTAEVAGDTWTVRTGPDGRVTYVRNADGLTTLVNSSAPRSVVEDYIESLDYSSPAAG